jgi:zinc protease
MSFPGIGNLKLCATGLALAVLALCVAPAHGAEGNVLRATLGNGLRVVMVRDTLAPVIALSVNYLVGSDEAPRGFPGTAHAQEHMMFRGSPGLSADQLADIGSLMGGDFNANTREGLTQYLFTVPAADLDIALHIEATRMAGVLDSKQGWDQERGAIEQEVAQDLSNPEYVLYDKLRAIMFSGTPYAHDALGTRPSFEKTSAEMLKRFYDTWYAPNNAILIIVGDFDPPATLAKIRDMFGRISAKHLPARPRVRLRPVQLISLHLDTDQPTGTELLAISLDPLPQASLVYSEVSFPMGADPAALEAEVRAILAKVAKDGVPVQLVDAAKKQERRAAQFQRNSIAGLASVWSDAIALYGFSSPDDEVARIDKVTVAEVNRIARKYLDLHTAVSAVLTPQGAGRPVATSGGFGGQESIALGETLPAQLPDWAQSALGLLTVPASTIEPIISTLPNGLTLIVQPENISDTISVYGHIRNRPEIEASSQQQGVASVLEQLFSYGSEKLDRVQFEGALDQIGAEEHAGTDFAVEILAGDFDRGVALLADDELDPALPPAAMKVVANQLAQIVTARNHSSGYLTQRSLRTALYPPDDPSLREATPETVRALSLEDVRAYYRRVFRPDLTSIIVIGKISPEQARATIEKYFGSWRRQGAKPSTDLPVVPANQAGSIVVPDASRVQDNVILAQNLALTRANPDYYALELGSAVLGGGFYSTRLSVDLRKNAGLVYSVGSSLQAGRTRGTYFVRYACDPQNVGKAANIVMQELRNMQSTPPTVDELMRAKSLLVRRIPLSESSVEEIASGLIERRELELPLDEPAIAAGHYIELTGTQVQSAFQTWIRPDALVRVTQGPSPQ